MKITLSSPLSDFEKHGVHLQYVFNNSLCGSAAGTVYVKYTSNSTYHICWADDNTLPITVKYNEKTLKYSPLCSFDGDSIKEYTFKILDFTAIPQGAKKLVLTDENKSVLTYVDIPETKLLPISSPKYCFGVIADIHYNYFFNHDKTIDCAVDAMDRALDFYKKAGVSHVCAAGDYGIYSEEKSYQDFNSAVKKSGVKVIACGGNHELYAKLDVMYSENGIWRTYMNEGIYSGTDEGVLDIAENGIDFSYRIPNEENEIFVFLSQRYWDGHTAKQPMLLDPEQLLWLEAQFEKYSDKTVFLLFHTYLSDDDGENVDGEGDLKSTGGYSYNGHYNTYTPDEKILRGLLTKYKNVIWFNGHSHYEYSMQIYNENLNIFDYQGTTATMIHVPSVTNPRTVKPDSTSYSSLRGKASQGALHSVYNGYNIMNGMDLWNDEIQSYACYIIYTDSESIKKEGMLNSSISWTFDAQTSSLRLLGTGELTPAEPLPWSSFSEDILSLYIGKGITRIPEGIFCSLINLRRAEIKEGVTSIGSCNFCSCCLNTLILPETLEYISKGAFNSEHMVNELIYDGTKEKWGCVDILPLNDGLDASNTLFRKVQISFVADKSSLTVDVPLGKIPAFEDIPIKEHPQDDKYYVFIGWSNGDALYPASEPLPAAICNTAYTAVFGAEGERFISDSISFGEITWTLDRKKSTLTISGSGAVPDFDDLTLRPWDRYKNGISTLVISSGITDIGANSFKQLPALKHVVLMDGIRSLGKDALAYNKLLKTIRIPKSLSELGRGSVYSSDYIERVYYGGSPEEWEAFCNGITSYYNTNLTNTKDIIYFS